MRKTLIQIAVLIIAGALIAWREWTVYGTATTGLNKPDWVNPELLSEAAMPSMIMWLVLIAGVFFLFKESFSSKLSSPNSV